MNLARGSEGIMTILVVTWCCKLVDRGGANGPVSQLTTFLLWPKKIKTITSLHFSNDYSLYWPYHDNFAY